MIAKTVHHTMNITSTEVKLFSIRCKTNQTVQLPNVHQIIVITDVIPATRCIFDLSAHCCGNHLSQRQIITQTVNLLVGYQVGNSQENSTRSLC